MNKLQTHQDFYLKQQLKVVPSHYALLRGLREMGHEVTQDYVNLGDDISSYDKVIVYLHNVSGFCQFVYNGLYVISQRPDAILAFDDWQVDTIYYALQKLSENLFREYVVKQSRYTSETLLPFEPLFRSALNLIEKKENPLLLSMFAGGDPSLLLDYPPHLIHTFNPNPFHLNRVGRHEGPKERRCNFSSLVQAKTKKWLKSLKTVLPIDFYGSRKDKQLRLKEDEMVDVYARDWFTLMPGYYHSGSGWWRARPLQVADAGGILIGDPKELWVYYRDERASTPSLEDLQTLSPKELQAFAAHQRECLYRIHPLDKAPFFASMGGLGL